MCENFYRKIFEHDLKKKKFQQNVSTSILEVM